ncbi:pyocin knob domain-containing S74 family peptidase [Escherichia coli]|uniref:pyocin knob domain-containing S74 family peptidase n=1 Tax=Escherichia coli TaxID=562 RepID=UPI0004DAE557|nr:pyocin knob domain-containing S74 family peptidase [Escherichia coli]KDW32653.1 chaperone of endosialidase family protein [Escherichia coli 2-156-04_S3_C2]
MIYTTGTIAISGNTVTGTGTNFSAPLSLIRVGCTLIAISNPIQIFTITEIKNGTELSVTPAANPAIAAGTKFSILLSDSISVDGLAQDVAETLRFYQEKEDEISSAIDGSNIGLGPEPRDCTDISGNPSSYVGFLRIKETANGFPDVAAGESFLSGFICQRDGTPSYTGVFVGWSTRSLYTYTWVATSGPNWTRHARKDEIDRLLQVSNSAKETQLWDGEKKNYIFVNNTGWGAYSKDGAVKLGVMYGGTGGGNAGEARKNLMVMYDAKTSLDASQNLDDLKGSSSGFYHQVLSANAKPELNYPVQIAGSLLVQKTGAGDSEGCIQTYYLFNNMAISYRRAYGGQGWSAWKKIVSTERIEEGESTTYVYSNYLPTAPRFQVSTSGLWGCHNGSGWVPLAISQGGTGAASVDNARTNLGLGRNSSPQLDSLFLDKSSDSTSNYTSGGMLHTRLLASDNTVRLAGDMYVQTYPNELGRLTIRFICGGSTGTTRYLELTTEGNLLVDSAILKSNLEKPLQINSVNPAVMFNETDRPANTPTYTLVANAGDWFIQKRYYDDAGSVSNAIAYSFANDRLDVQNLKASGHITCVTVNQSSDRDLKDNIQVIGDATEAIRKMNGYTYTLKENGLPYAGVIAQEVMEALPEAVGSFTHYGEALQGPTIDGNELREETRYLNVDYAAVTGLLVQVARETDNRVTELEEENASLRANIAVMDERITKLEALVRKLTGSEK